MSFETGERTPAAGKPEKIESDVTLKKLTAEYCQLAEEDTLQDEGLRKSLETLRRRGLFQVDVYSEKHGYMRQPTQNLDKLRVPIGASETKLVGEVVNDPSTSAGFNLRKLLKKHGAKECLAYSPMRQEQEVSSWLGLKKTAVNNPVLFREVSVEAKPDDEQPAVRLIYVVSDEDWPTKVRSESGKNIATEAPNTSDVFDQKNGMMVPQGNVEDRVHAMLELRQVEDLVGRKGASMAIAVVLPEKDAKKLFEYFKKHPDAVRQFFIAGGLEHMAYHNPPDYQKWDSEQSDRSIVFRQFNNEYEAPSDTPIKPK